MCLRYGPRYHRDQNPRFLLQEGSSGKAVQGTPRPLNPALEYSPHGAQGNWGRWFFGVPGGLMVGPHDLRHLTKQPSTHTSYTMCLDSG